MTTLPALFSDQPKVQKSASAETHGDILEVRTSPQQWAYAVMFPKTDPAQLDDAVVIRVALHVVRGCVGVGCLNAEASAFLDEVFIEPTSAPTTAEIVIAGPVVAGSLVVRNASPDGPSEVRLLGVDWETLQEEDAAREPPLSEPRPMPGWSRYYATLGATLTERLRVRRFHQLESPRTMSWTDGARLVVLPHDQLSRAVYVSGTYEPNTLSVLKALTPPGGVFLDIGANAGIMSLAAAIWVGEQGRVFSFEPSQREFDRLTENLRSSGLSRVEAVRAAVTDHDGEVTLRVAAGAYAGLNTLGDRFAYAGVEAERLEPVTAVTLDRFLAAEGVRRVDAMKIDVEGAEGAVLTGATETLRTHRPALVAEVFSRSLEATGWDRARLTALFAGAGYELFSLDDQTAHPVPLRSLQDIDEQNVLALPQERVKALVSQILIATDLSRP